MKNTDETFLDSSFYRLNFFCSKSLLNLKTSLWSQEAIESLQKGHKAIGKHLSVTNIQIVSFIVCKLWYSKSFLNWSFPKATQN